MRPKQRRLARHQLDETLNLLRPLTRIPRPGRGWVRAIRETLGMTGEQLARRLGTNKQRVSRIEQDEAKGKLTLTTLRRVAEALDCSVVYALVPRQSLEQTIQQQAVLLAHGRLQRSNQMMRLEQQELNREEHAQVLRDLVDEIVDESPKALWEDR